MTVWVIDVNAKSREEDIQKKKAEGGGPKTFYEDVTFCLKLIVSKV